jgi:hypothetical protein
MRCNHLPYGCGTELRFIGKTGTHHKATVVAETTITSDSDMKLLTLDQPLPADVEPARVLPLSVYTKLSKAFTTFQAFNGDGCLAVNLPCVYVNQMKRIHAGDAFYFDTGGGGVAVAGSRRFPTWANQYNAMGR